MSLDNDDLSRVKDMKISNKNNDDIISGEQDPRFIKNAQNSQQLLAKHNRSIFGKHMKRKSLPKNEQSETIEE